MNMGNESSRVYLRVSVRRTHQFRCGSVWVCDAPSLGSVSVFAVHQHKTVSVQQCPGTTRGPTNH